MKYLLDTNILSELVKKRPKPGFIQRIKSVSPHALFTSAICVFELRLGSALRDDHQAFWSRIENNIISRVQVLEFGEKEAELAGDIVAQLRKSGKQVGLENAFIAATALSRHCVMVSANIRHYQRIDRLKVENRLQ